MRHCYLVCYDICEPKRLQKIYKMMKGFGEHWQFSVFFCVLKDIDRVRMQTKLEDLMNQNDDQIMILDLGENEETARMCTKVLGRPLPRQFDSIAVF